MPGIIQNAQAQPASQVPGQDPASPPGGVQESGEINDQEVSPQEQEQYERIVGAASKILYDEKMSNQIVEALKGAGGDPSGVIANLAGSVIDELGKQAKGKLPVDLILPATNEILELIGEIAESANLFQYDEAMHAKASQKAIEMIAPRFGASDEDIQEFMGSMGPEAENMKAQHESMTGGASV